MNSLSSISYSLEKFGPLRDWCVLGSYRGPLNASDWQLRLKLNWSRYRLSYLSLWALTTWMINAPSVYGSFFWVFAFVVCFIVRHPLLTQPKKITMMCLGMIVMVSTSSCQSSACLSWSQLMAFIVIVGHASFLADGPAALRAPTPAPAPMTASAVKTPSKSLPIPKYAPPVAPGPAPSPAAVSTATSPSKAGAEPATRDSDKRSKIVQEIYSTEISYLGTLQLVKDNFLDPLRDLSAGKDALLSAEDVRNIFSDIEVILNYSISLAEDLKQRLVGWNNSSSKLGDIFIRIGHFLKTYQPYVVNYSTCISTLQKCCKSEDFAAHLRRLELDPRCKNGSLQSFLITPIQRIPRYLLLLKEVIKNTSVSHPDYQDLQKSLEQISQVASSLNEAERAAESTFKLFTLQMAVGNEVELLSPHRRFVTEGVLRGNIKTDDPDSELLDFYIILCNDMMLVCKNPSRRLSGKPVPKSDSPAKSPIELPTKLALKRMFKLHQVTLKSVQGNMFTLGSAELKCIFEAANVTEKKDWLQKLQSAMSESNEKAARLGW